MEPNHIVIVGAGQAGGRCAEALRQMDFAGAVTVIGDESHPPYERPSLSKEFLSGNIAEEAMYLRPPAWYEENRIALLADVRVTTIERERKSLLLDDGRAVPYTAAVIATGARLRKLRVPGAELPGVCYLRTIDDSRLLRERLQQGARIAIIGAGLIGLEVAATAVQQGCAVTVIEIDVLPMARVVAPEMSRHYLAVHCDKGVAFHTGTSVDEIERDDNALAVVLRNGERIVADTVLVCIGVEPNVELAVTSGLPASNGIEVDEYGRTADPDIYAIGDCASLLHPALGRRIRLEQWQHAQNHAIAIARNIVEQGAPYTELPWAWTSQYGANLQMVGAPESWDKVVWRGDPGAGKAILFYLADGCVVAANGIGAAREMRFLKRLVERKARVEPALLADESVRLDSIAA